MNFITINDLSFSYKEQHVLEQINLTIKTGDFIALLGPSGSGKSTLLKILARVLKSYDGTIMVKQTNLKEYKKPFAYMPQNHLLLPYKTLLQNVIIPLTVQGKPAAVAKAIAKPFLPEFNLSKLINNYPSELSGGEKQRAALVRSMLVPTNFLLLDEPFSQLDAITRVKLQQFLHRLYQKYHYTVLLVTHDIDEAILLANQIHVMNHKGAITNSFTINLPRTRTDEVLLSNNFLNYKKQIIKALANC